MINYRYLDIAEVKHLTSLSEATIYRQMDKGVFPNSHDLTDNRVAWRDIDIFEWMNTRKPSTGINRKHDKLLNKVFS
ncbi:AlpA family phage regulatory protein [Photobacterium ganghwense]|nr:AlpA family phage regulatory protein [Photobacterium ganghwense]